TIAIGAAQVMGYELMQNFNRPMMMVSMADFWRKWHISLMKWFRDYLFIPLVRQGKLSKNTAVMVVFFFCGLWHGADWTFVIWGVLCGLLLLADTNTVRLRRRWLSALGICYNWRWVRVINSLFQFAIIVLPLVFFRSSSVGNAVAYFKNMFSWHEIGRAHV